MASENPLDAEPDEIRRAGHSAVEMMADYLGSVPHRRVYPNVASREIRDQLDARLPHDPQPIDEVLAAFRDVLVPNSRQNAHPRMFGYVQAPGTAVAAIADLLASTLNANLTAWRSAPAAVELERLTIEWIKEIVGCDRGAAGLFVSGGSMANFAALAAARGARSTGHGDNALRIYASEETHHSIAKAATLLGIGSENVRHVQVDERFRIRIDDLEAKIAEDLHNGHRPFVVVANAGTVNTGAFDSLREVARAAQQFGLWMHVDASYGGFARLAPSARALFDGIEHADSISLDPHKWLYLPVDCGCVLYRDPQTARAAFAHEAEYTRVISQEADEAFAFWDYGPELSRRFRALKVWMTLKTVGVRAFSDSIEKDIGCARHLESLVRASDDFEMLAPVELSIFCFRHVPAQLRGASGEQVDSWNERLLVALQRDGSSYLSNARINGRFALRGCVLNYRTTFNDMEILLADLRRVAAQLGA